MDVPSRRLLPHDHLIEMDEAAVFDFGDRAVECQ
jgi:hypothetical protein